MSAAARMNVRRIDKYKSKSPIIVVFNRLYAIWRIARVGRVLHRATRDQDLDEATPRLVALKPSATKVLALARALADDQREGKAAVQELVRSAGGNRETLRYAALGTRQNGEHLESLWANTTYRLLIAARDGTTISPLSAGEFARLARLDGFASLDIEERWNVLLCHAPELGELQSAARAGEFGFSISPRESDKTRGDAQQMALPGSVNGRRQLMARLTNIVGPDCPVDDALLRSKIALATVRYWIVRPLEGSCGAVNCCQATR